jgi:tRNA A-37 threonylcarbamoyl transferase component Bud32
MTKSRSIPSVASGRLRNPFFSRQRITDPACFRGRHKEIESLYSAIVTHQSRSLVGERKLGKSSLLTALAQPATMQRFGLDPARTLLLYLDLEGMASAQREDFWIELVDRLGVTLPPGDLRDQAERLRAEAERTGELRFTTLRRLLRRVRDGGLDLVLTLDEFEGLARNANFTPDFYGELRSLAGEMGIVYLTASKRGLYDLTYHHSATLSSPFFNIFSEMPLGLMPDDEARDLLLSLSQQGQDAPFCDEELDLGLELAGPHPFFLQIAGFHLYEMPGRGRPHLPDAYDQAARRFNAEAEDHYRYLWSQLNDEEQQALLSPNEAGEAARKDLLARAFIRPDSVPGAQGAGVRQSGRRFVPFGHAFAVFLEGKRHEQRPTPAHVTSVDTPTATDLTGKRLGNYRVLAALGQGGMAKVYKGYQPLLDRYVAIKVLAPHFATDEEFRARFQREAAAVAKLRQPNIVQVYDFGVEGPVYYMVMEYIAGDTLKARIRTARDTGERISPAEVLEVLRGIASALDYAHERAIIHRDVKPANVMLRVEEAGPVHARGAFTPTPVLTDFGVAKILEGVQFTGTGMTIGTPDYMAPEQGSGREITPSADLYSLAVILYEMLVGELPFTADTPVAVLLKHLSDTPPPLHLRAPDLPPALDKVLDRALAKKPEERYPSGAALVQAVEQACGLGAPGGAS